MKLLTFITIDDNDDVKKVGGGGGVSGYGKE